MRVWMYCLRRAALARFYGAAWYCQRYVCRSNVLHGGCAAGEPALWKATALLCLIYCHGMCSCAALKVGQCSAGVMCSSFGVFCHAAAWFCRFVMAVYFS
ncbi:hypothetical protein NPIL_311871 [Nephila pilipes]|uniref:Uncharacterized protein n=1 Tax=Nephila pilipes TaxID=299642 RepID=A0A8X6NRE5_NEPPI|nr:hypothetical protein NPIL_311871 [Nephila pilipes]